MELKIAQNNVTAIPVCFGESFPALAVLDMSDNAVKDFPASVLATFSPDMTLEIVGNPIVRELDWSASNPPLAALPSLLFSQYVSVLPQKWITKHLAHPVHPFAKGKNEFSVVMCVCVCVCVCLRVCLRV